MKFNIYCTQNKKAYLSLINSISQYVLIRHFNFLQCVYIYINDEWSLVISCFDNHTCYQESPILNLRLMLTSIKPLLLQHNKKIIRPIYIQYSLICNKTNSLNIK